MGQADLEVLYFALGLLSLVVIFLIAMNFA